MSDEKPMAETFQTIADQIRALRQSMDQGFARVDVQLADVKAHLGVRIEAVDAKVGMVYDSVVALQEHSDTNRRDHERFTKQLDDHDVRILALEHSKRPKS